MKAPPAAMVEALERRGRNGALRTVRVADAGSVDLCSNDYLGVARRLGEGGAESLARLALGDHVTVGATGSRLLRGTHQMHLDLERFLATFHRDEAALLFGSGYEANVGLLASIGTRHDILLFDELVHASMRDGVRLATARSFSFKHNDLADLRAQLEARRPSAGGVCYVLVESVYSMDGDQAPLEALVALCQEFSAYLIVDEAHSSGVYGEHGEGLVCALGLEEHVFARVHTFGKAFGFRGACVVGSATLSDFLRNFARPFIYSTAPDLLSLQLVKRSYELVAAANEERAALRGLIAHWKGVVAHYPQVDFLCTPSPIQGVVFPGNERVVQVERELARSGFDVRAIRAPTVPAGQERLRISLHAFNTAAQLEAVVSVVAEFQAGGMQV